MMTRVMLCFGYHPVDLQALYKAADRQGLCCEECAPYVSPVLGPGCSAADWKRSRGGFVIARARSSRGTPLCSAVCWLSPGKVHALRGGEGK